MMYVAGSETEIYEIFDLIDIKNKMFGVKVSNKFLERFNKIQEIADEYRYYIREKYEKRALRNERRMDKRNYFF